MQFAATWMDLVNIILSEVSKKDKYMWKVKNKTNESTYKTETNS